MPLYEYDCKGCSKQVEILVSSATAKPTCPQCGSNKLNKLLSVIGSPVIANGADLARKSSFKPNNCGRSQCASGGCMNGN